MVKQFVIVQDIMRDVKRNIRIYCKFMKGDTVKESRGQPINGAL